MSRFLSRSAASLTPYTPGEQPRDTRLIKLNTNESPYPPSPLVSAVLRDFNYGQLRLYPDPDAGQLRDAIAAAQGVEPSQVIVGGGSDELLGYAFLAFFERGDIVLFPDVTYGFYPVHARLCGLNAVTIPLREDFTVRVSDYDGAPGHIVLANPNAPTGLPLTSEQLERILHINHDKLLIVDEAYIDFSIENTAKPLLKSYDNLLIVRTYSKSYGLAGMRIGYALGSSQLISALNRIKYAFNPYNLDRLSIMVGVAATGDRQYVEQTVSRLAAGREHIKSALADRDFSVLDSRTNFLFARHPAHTGSVLYNRLRERGVLVRHFDKPDRISDYLRISIGSEEDMLGFMRALDELL